MSKFIIKIGLATLLFVSTLSAAYAGPHYGHGYRHGHHHGHYRGGYGWAPWVGGALIGAALYDIYNRPVVVQQPPIIVQQPPMVVEQRIPQCTPWTETRQADGTIISTRTCQ